MGWDGTGFFLLCHWIVQGAGREKFGDTILQGAAMQMAEGLAEVQYRSEGVVIN